MIEIQALTKQYGSGAKAVRALDGLDLRIAPGMFGLLGPNGAGKTTFMRTLAGIVRPSSGEVRVAGHDLNTEAGRIASKAVLGYLPQDLGMYGELTAAQFVDYMAILKGLGDTRARRRRVAEVLEMVALEKHADRKVGGFSGGMKRRVGIAQALVNDPRLLIVDEPTAGLDPEERIRFRNLLVSLAGERTVLLSTHIVEDIGQTCREIAVLAGGKVRFRGTTQELAEAAAGHVFSFTSPTPVEPGDGATIVSMLHLSDGIQYRWVGSRESAGPTAEEVRPSLEDGYMWLMRKA